MWFESKLIKEKENPSLHFFLLTSKQRETVQSPRILILEVAVQLYHKFNVNEYMQFFLKHDLGLRDGRNGSFWRLLPSKDARRL